LLLIYIIIRRFLITFRRIFRTKKKWAWFRAIFGLFAGVYVVFVPHCEKDQGILLNVTNICLLISSLARRSIVWFNVSFGLLKICNCNCYVTARFEIYKDYDYDYWWWRCCNRKKNLMIVRLASYASMQQEILFVFLRYVNCNCKMELELEWFLQFYFLFSYWYLWNDYVDLGCFR
jgi:hypothetical protein